MAESVRYRGRLTWRAVTWTFWRRANKRIPRANDGLGGERASTGGSSLRDYILLLFYMFVVFWAVYLNMIIPEMEVSKGTGAYGCHTPDLPLSASGSRRFHKDRE